MTMRLYLRCLFVSTLIAGNVAESGVNRAPVQHQEMLHLASFLVDYCHSTKVQSIILCPRATIGNTWVWNWLTMYVISRGVMVLPCFTNDPTTSQGNKSNASVECLLSQPGKPSVTITDEMHLVESLIEAESHYQSEWGSVKQLLLGSSLSINSTLATASNASSSVVMHASYYSFKQEVLLTAVYRFRTSTHLLLDSVGRWQPQAGLSLQQAFWDGPSDLQGHLLYLTAIADDPCYMKIAKGENMMGLSRSRQCGLIDDHGYLLDIIELLARELNFTYIIEIPEKEVFGNSYLDGCIGLTGALCKREADVALGCLIYTIPRLDTMDYGFTVIESYHSLIYGKKAITYIIRWSTYLETFHYTVWIAALGILMVSSAVFVMASRNRDENTGGDDPIRDSIFMHFNCLFQQGYHSPPSSCGPRIVFLSFWVFSYVLYAYYSALLTSFLTLTTPVTPFNSLRDVIEDKDWYPFALLHSAPHNFLKSMKEEWAQDTVEEIINDPRKYTATSKREITEKILSSNAVYFGFIKMLVNVQARMGKLSLIHFQRVDRIPTPLTLGFTKNFPFYKKFYFQIMDLQATGVMKHLEERWFEPFPDAYDSNKVQPFELSNTVMVFVFLGAGMVLAFIIFVMEKLSRSPSQVESSSL